MQPLAGITVEEITVGETLFPNIGNPFALGAQSMTVLFMFLTSMTAATQLVQRDFILGQSEQARDRRNCHGRCLRGRPDFDRITFEPGGTVLRLEIRMRGKLVGIEAFGSIPGRGEGRFDIALVGQ